jgi:hypothetical protein
MTLSKEQIAQLFLFTEKKFVRGYDLQIELVDHLAERIEEEMEANPAVGFDLALQKVYAGFGIFGFAKIVQQKSLEVSKTNNRIWINEVKQFFTIPKVFLLVCLIIVTYTLSGIVSNASLIYFWDGFWILQNVALFVMISKSHSKKIKDLMLLQFNPYCTIGFIPIYQILLFDGPVTIHRLWFTTAVVTGIVVSIAYAEVYKQVRKKAIALYPEAFALN